MDIEIDNADDSEDESQQGIKNVQSLPVRQCSVTQQQYPSCHFGPPLQPTRLLSSHQHQPPVGAGGFVDYNCSDIDTCSGTENSRSAKLPTAVHRALPRRQRECNPRSLYGSKPSWVPSGFFETYPTPESVTNESMSAEKLNGCPFFPDVCPTWKILGWKMGLVVPDYAGPTSSSECGLDLCSSTKSAAPSPQTNTFTRTEIDEGLSKYYSRLPKCPKREWMQRCEEGESSSTSQWGSCAPDKAKLQSRVCDKMNSKFDNCFIHNKDGGFSYMMDLSCSQPEIKAKLNGLTLDISTTLEMKRAVNLPSDVDTSTVKCSFSPDSQLLCVTGMIKKSAMKKNSRSMCIDIPIVKSSK